MPSGAIDAGNVSVLELASLPTSDASCVGPAARRPRRPPRRRRGLARSPSDTQAIVAATDKAARPHSPVVAAVASIRLIGRVRSYNGR